MPIITKLSATDIKPECKIVPVPNLDLGAGADPDAQIIVKKMNVADAVFRQDLVNKHAVDDRIAYPKMFMAGLITTMVDDDDNRIADPDELDALLAKMDDKTFDALHKAFEELNPSLAITKGELKEKKSKS